MTQKPNASKSAKLLYRPVGLATSMAAGVLAGMVFKWVWAKAVHGEDADPPTPLQSDYDLKEILAAAVVQGAIYSTVKALTDRGGARLFEKVTGDWPGN